MLKVSWCWYYSVEFLNIIYEHFLNEKVKLSKKGGFYARSYLTDNEKKPKNLIKELNISGYDDSMFALYKKAKREWNPNSTMDGAVTLPNWKRL